MRRESDYIRVKCPADGSSDVIVLGSTLALRVVLKDKRFHFRVLFAADVQLQDEERPLHSLDGFWLTMLVGGAAAARVSSAAVQNGAVRCVPLAFIWVDVRNAQRSRLRKLAAPLLLNQFQVMTCPKELAAAIALVRPAEPNGEAGAQHQQSGG